MAVTLIITDPTDPAVAAVTAVERRRGFQSPQRLQ